LGFCDVASRRRNNCANWSVERFDAQFASVRVIRMPVVVRTANLLIDVSFRHPALLWSISAIPVAWNLLAKPVPNPRMPESQAPRDAR